MSDVVTNKEENTSRPVPTAGVQAIEAYVPGKSKVSKPTGKVYKLSSNETPLGASPKAKAALVEIAENLELYPDGYATALREAIASNQGLEADQIICGCGSGDILNLLANAYLSEGDEAIFSEHEFLLYEIVIKAAGGTPVVAPDKDLTVNVDAILAAVTSRTKMVFVANPNNPTGTYLPFSEIERLHKGLPAHVLLVLDAAYAEYVSRNDYNNGARLAASAENVVMTRTFSKIYGLANLRIGWAYGAAHIIETLNRIRGPFNVNGGALAAATAAIEDVSFMGEARAHNDFWLPKVTSALEAIGLSVTPSVGNFILIHCLDEAGKDAEAIDQYLQENGVIIRRVTSYGFPNGLRMTIGSSEANIRAVGLIAECLGKDLPANWAEGE